MLLLHILLLTPLQSLILATNLLREGLLRL
jgi:hypothetical protein